MTGKADGLGRFYADQIRHHILPFWLRGGIDTEMGGYYTCFENSGERLVSTDKYTWSQGRMVYIFASLSRMDIFDVRERSKFLSLAESGAEFLMKHARLENGNCVFVMDRAGNPKTTSDDAPLDASVYADCFAILGLAAFALASGRMDAYRFAADLYAHTAQRIQDGRYETAPYPVPAGFRHHGIPMIMLNTTQELADAAEVFSQDDRLLLLARAGEYAGDILENFVDADGTLREMKPLAGGHDDARLIGRYVNPGHVIEDMWFIIEYAQAAGRDELIERAAQIAKKTFKLGWDAEFGGIRLFCDKDGGLPKGDTADTAEEPMVKKVCADWGSKLWWVHSEALYTMLLCHRLTGDDEFLALYEQAAAYTFKTFPDVPEVGEWVQIRDREGRPETRVVALPVKDPFHILRNFIKIVKLEDTHS